MRLRKRTHHQPVSNHTDNTPTGRLKGRGLAYIDDAESHGRMSATANSGPLRNSSVGQLPIEVDVDPLLKDIVFSEDLEQKKLVMRLYTDMYYNDCVAGSIVDIKASLMFSEFTLGGILDRKVAEVFQENVERLNIRTLLPEASVDHDVKGAFVGSLLYNEERKVFVDIMPHGYENCKVDMLPFFGQDPLITVAFPESVRNTLNGSESPRIKAIREYLGPTVMQQIAKDALELDPKSTVYMPRKAFTNSTGVSYYRRILPIYLLEKNLFRGTLVESARRQRGILHITLDGNGEWEPTVADFNMITELFQNADADPLGAVIATRSGISLDEVRCIAGDSLISTDAGIVRIDSIVSHNADGNVRSVPVDIKIKGCDGLYVDVDQWHYQGNKQAFKITTSSGTVLKATDNHKFMVCTGGGDLKLKRLADIVDTDYIFSESNGRACVTAKLPLGLEYPKVKIGKQAHNQTIKLPKYMTPDLAYLIGLIVSEGYFNHAKVNVTNCDANLISASEELFTGIFGVRTTTRLTAKAGTIIGDHTYPLKQDRYDVSVNGGLIVDVMRQLGLSNYTDGVLRASHFKVIPWSILEADKESQLAFLAAYIDGDGSVVVNKNAAANGNGVEIKFFSRSEDILQGIKVMLANLGYHATVDMPSFRVNLQTSESGRLYNALKKYLRTDRKKPFDFCDVLARRQFGIPPQLFMPVLNSRWLRRGNRVMGGNWFADDDGNPVHVRGSFKHLFRHYEHAGSYLLYDAFDTGAYAAEMELIGAVSRKLYNRIVNFVARRLVFERVVSKESVGVIPVYDISVCGNERGKTPLFLANGIVTKNSGGDFWKVTDVWDSTLSMKLKALGISESFLSGDATFSNQDTSLSFFIDGLRSQRDLQTRKILYNRIFPLISALNGFTLNNRGKLIRSGNVLDKIDPMGSMDILNDGTRLLIPSVHWAKTLKPEGDQSYLDMLQSLTEKGVPVPLRALAAAGGFNLDMLLAAQEGDMDMTRRIAEYNKKVGEIKKEFGPAEAEGGADAAFAAANYLSNLSNRTKSDVLAQGSGRMVGLANRDYGEMFEVAGETHDGKKRYLHNQKLANERANRKIAKMLEDINQRGNTHLSRTTVTSYR